MANVPVHHGHVPPQGGYIAKWRPCRAHFDQFPDLADRAVAPNEGAARRMESGNVFEDEIGDLFASVLDTADAVFLAKDPVVDGVRDPAAKTRREQDTMAAIAAGALFIWNARLPADLVGCRISEPDALVYWGVNALGNPAYVPLDVKDHAPMQGTTQGRRWQVSELATPGFAAAVWTDIGPGVPRVEDSEQLAHYLRHLEALGHAADVPVGGIVGRSRRIVWRDLDEALYLHHDRVSGARRKMSPLDIYDSEFAFRLAVVARARAIAAGADLAPLVEPQLSAECSNCPWRVLCHDMLEDADHITLLEGVTLDKARPHVAVNLTTRTEMAQVPWATAAALDAGLPVHTLARTARLHPDQGAPAGELVAGERAHISLGRGLADAGLVTVADVAALDDQVAVRYLGQKVSGFADAVDQARVHTCGRVHLRRDVHALDVPRGDVELDVDMENGPDGLVYLWGTWLDVRTDAVTVPGPAYRPFVTFGDGDDAGEAAAFAELWAWITYLHSVCAAAGLTFRAYCYTSAENRCLRSLAAKHAGVPGVPSPDEVEAFIASTAWVDLYDVVRRLRWPTENLSLKTVAKHAGFAWRDKDAGGDNSITWYLEAIADPDPDVRAAARQRVLDYNEDDVKATQVLRDWLDRLRSNGVERVDVLEARFARQAAIV